MGGFEEWLQVRMTAMPRLLSSVIIGLAWGVVMGPVFILMAGPENIRVALVITGLTTAGGIIGFHWSRLRWGDAKGPGRRIQNSADREAE